MPAIGMRDGRIRMRGAPGLAPALHQGATEPFTTASSAWMRGSFWRAAR